jgi:hypothetical protein
MRREQEVHLPPAAITIRPATKDGGTALAQLAALDSAELPTGRLIIGQADGAIRAALSVEDGRVIADPFIPTTHLVALLRAHLTQRGQAPRWSWLRPVLGS